MATAHKQSGIIAISIFVLCLSKPIQTPAAGTNSWTNSATGAWESLSWSLGVRPDISQAGAAITNYGQKAVILGANARDNYPASLSISNLLIAGTSLSTNTLLLNYTGTTTPLRVYNSCIVQTNGVLLNLYSAIDVTGSNAATYVDGGTINQTGGSNRFEGALYVGNNAAGQYNSTNGTVVADTLYVGKSSSGTFNQVSGSVSAQYLGIGAGLYTLSDGTLEANQADIGLPGTLGQFVQNGGTFIVSNGFNDGSTYTLNNGLLQAASDNIGYTGGGNFVQTGGTHNTGHITMGSYYTAGGISYTLSGGIIHCTGINLEGAEFSHSVGTNFVSGSLSIADANYNLSGGELDSDSESLGADRTGAGWFGQTGGRHIVTNTLDISGETMGGGGPIYFLANGSLDCGQLDVYGYGTFQHTGGSLMVHGQVTIGSRGTLTASNVTEQFGPLVVSGGPAFDQVMNSSQHFADSSKVPWDPNAYLIISGGGPVYFGNSASALTPHQLLQIYMAGGGGDYVELLPTGQLVPAPVPPIDFQFTTTNLTLNWTATTGFGNPSSLVLQSADNVTGPYVDVQNATNLYAVPFNGKSKFYRLRHS